jgi:hypothetical protein
MSVENEDEEVFMKDNKFNKNHDEMYKELIYGN